MKTIIKTTKREQVTEWFDLASMASFSQQNEAATVILRSKLGFFLSCNGKLILFIYQGGLSIKPPPFRPQTSSNYYLYSLTIIC